MLDRILIVDIECTCWDPKPTSKSKEFESEIIEIGVCVLNLKQEKLYPQKSILVQPRYSKISEFCTKLTTLTQADVDSGVSLEEACNILRSDFESNQVTWASWGDYDRNQFERECRAKSIRYPFRSRHINLKNLFAITRRLDFEVGMPQALEMLNLPLEGIQHRGGDDAWNIAKLAKEILKPQV